MSQVIEETIRGGGGPRPSELEGLACPRTKSPVPPGPGGPPVPPPGPPSSKHPAGSFRGHNGGNGNGNDLHDYPAMEGLSARFNSNMFKRVENSDLMTSSGGRSAHPNKPPGGPLGGPNGPWESQHPNSAYGYRSAHFQQQQQPPTGSHPMPPMGSSAATAASFANSVGQPPRKRASPSSTMPVLPPKKQHIDSVGGVDYSFHKGKLF